MTEPKIPRQKDKPSMLDGALRCSQQGWFVIPLHSIKNGRCTCGKADCGNQGKHPRITEWQNKGSKGPSMIKAWWMKWPDSNIGLVTGKVSGFFVLDVDPDKGGGKSLQELESKYGKLPETTRQRTGGGGQHFLFKHPGQNVDNKVALAPGLDVRGDGGMVVVAPSLHVSGQRYKWLLVSAVLAISPDWLLELIQSQGKSKLTVKDWGKDIPDGERDVELTRRIGKLIRDGHSPKAVLAMAEGLNIAFCKPPLKSAQVEKIVRSIASRGTAKPERKEFSTTPNREMFLKYGEDELKWAVDGWLPEASCGLIVAPPGSYKTWLLCALAFSTSTGHPFLGQYRVIGKGPVLAIQQEDPFPMLMSKLAKMFNSKEPTVEGTAYELDCGFVEEMLDMPIHWHEDRELNLENKECMLRIEAKIAEIRPVLVTIDPLYSGVSAKDYMALGAQSMLQLKKLRDKYGCSFAIAHHTTVAGSSSEDRATIWGSQFLNAWLEFGWQIRETGDKDGGVKIVRHFKGSGSPKKLRLVFKITDYSFRAEVSDATTSVSDRIEEAIMNGGRFGSERAIADAIDCSSAMVHKVIKKIGLEKDEEGCYTISSK